MLCKKMPLFLISIGILAGLAAWEMLAPQKVFSDLENRVLSKLSKPTISTVYSGQWMRELETTVADQFPFRAQWIALQALEDAALLRNQRNDILIGRGGWLFERAANLELRTAQNNIAALNKIAARTQAQVTLMLIPMSSAVYPNALPLGYSADDQAELLQALYGETAGVQTICLLEDLRAETTEEPLYFRTDHHWTMAGAKVAYNALRETWRLPAVDNRQNVFFSPTGHYGSYYARSPNPLIRPDVFQVAYPANITLEIEGVPQAGLFDSGAMATQRDKYAQLLYGNHGQITLTGSGAKGVLLVMKDSYANLLLPWLAQHYQRVEAIDMRYYTGEFEKWIQEQEEEVTILCIYGLTTWISDRNLPRRAASWED